MFTKTLTICFMLVASPLGTLLLLFYHRFNCSDIGESIVPLLYAVFSYAAYHFSFVHTAFEPPSILTPPQPIVTAASDGVQHNIAFICTAVGDPTPNISWTHSMQNISQNERFQVMATEDDGGISISSTLAIDNLTEADNGIIRCVADNHVGDASADTTLSVLSKHSAVILTVLPAKRVHLVSVTYLCIATSDFKPIRPF